MTLAGIDNNIKYIKVYKVDTDATQYIHSHIEPHSTSDTFKNTLINNSDIYLKTILQTGHTQTKFLQYNGQFTTVNTDDFISGLFVKEQQELANDKSIGNERVHKIGHLFGSKLAISSRLMTRGEFSIEILNSFVIQGNNNSINLINLS